MTDSRRAWWAVTAMFGLNGALFGIWASRVPAVAEKHGLGPGALGLVLLMMAAGAILSFPIAGRGADRVGAYRVTWIAALGYLAALAGLALAPNVATLALMLFAFGAMHGAQDVAMNAWAGEVERRAGRAMMSSFHAMWSLGAGLGAVSGYVAVKLGAAIPVHFVLAGGAVALVTLSVARIGWASDRHAPQAGAPVFALPRGALFLVGLAAMAAAIGEGGMADWSAIFLVRVTGANEAMAALGYAAYSVVMVAVRLSGDWITGRFGPVLAARVAGLSASTGAALAVIFASYPMALFGFALMGVGYALVIPLAFSRAANDPVLKPGAAIASVSTLGYGGILMGPPLLGFVAEISSVRFSFLVLAALALVISLLAGALKRD
jgi:MFS family permease